MIQKPLLFEMFKDLAAKNPDYSFGELLYTITRPKYLKVNMNKITDLRDIPDNKFFTALEGALQNESKTFE